MSDFASPFFLPSWKNSASDKASAKVRWESETYKNARLKIRIECKWWIINKSFAIEAEMQLHFNE